MLADPRAAALSTRFASQWLRLQDLDKIHPDARLYPAVRRHARRRDAPRDRALLRQHRSRRPRRPRPAARADYTFVNERLARHYGIPNVTGPAFRRVALADPNRRGIFGHGSILTMTSVADRTSPVLRGKWVLEVLIGMPPPPPPPNVPALRGDEGRARIAAALGARAHGRAPHESGRASRAIASSIRSASRSRTSTSSACGASATAARRSTRRARCTTARR